MLVPVFVAIAIVLVGICFVWVVKTWDDAVAVADNHFTFPDQGVSLSSFVLLLFSCSSSAPGSASSPLPPSPESLAN